VLFHSNNFRGKCYSGALSSENKIKQKNRDILASRLTSEKSRDNDPKERTVPAKSGHLVTLRYGQGLSPLHVVQTGSGAYPASSPLGAGGSFPGVRAAGA
jgi:hypothetical protein